MLDNARQFVPAVKNKKLILLGGINNRDHMVTGLREGFDFVALGRALLREPHLVRKLMDDPTARGLCNHNNKCMVTVFGRTPRVGSRTGRRAVRRPDLYAARTSVSEH